MLSGLRTLPLRSRSALRAAPMAQRGFRSALPARTDDENTNGTHLFQPLAAQMPLSPMKRSTTWIEALQARQKEIREGKTPSDSYRATNAHALDPKVSDRSRDDSFSYVVLPFAQDKWLLDAYINSAGRLRIGQIFQDLDALAAVISYKHCAPAEPMLVTASVDRVYMLKRLDHVDQANVVLAGFVTWTGRTSMEISIKAYLTSKKFNPHNRFELAEERRMLVEADLKDDELFLTCNMTFVARNPVTKKGFPVNRLVPRNEAEWLDFRHAESYNAKKRLDASKTALSIQPPSEEESQLIHYLWLKDKQYMADPASRPRNVVPMEKTRIHSTMIMQPQYRNLHSYMIFGGYLLRQTFELAYCCAAAFSKRVPRFVSLDSTTFRAPVPVGSVMYLTATVAYTEHVHRKLLSDESSGIADQIDFITKPGTLVQVRVDSTVHDLDHGHMEDTGSFAYSFFIASDVDPTKPELYSKESENPLDEQGFYSVLPQTYNEMMMFIDGRRRTEDSVRFSKTAIGDIITE